MASPYSVTNLATINAGYFQATVPGDLPALVQVKVKWTDATPKGGRAIIGARLYASGDSLGNTLYAQTAQTTDTDATEKAGSSTGPTVAVGGAGVVTAGSHDWSYTYVLANGAEVISATTTNSGADGAHTMSLTNVTVGPSGTTARKVYRTKAGVPGVTYLVGTIADNVTTTFSDNITDAGLGASYTRAYSVRTPTEAVYWIDYGTVTGWSRRLYGNWFHNVQGIFRVYARVQKTVATDEHWIRLGWSAGSGATGLTKNEIFVLDGKDYNTTNPILIDLGLVDMELASSYQYGYVELYSTRKSGSGALLVDHYIAFPTEAFTQVEVVPGLQDDWAGDEYANSVGAPLTGTTGFTQLATAGDKLRFHTGNPGAGTYGMTLAASAHHIFEFDVEATDATAVTTVQVYDNTAALSLASRTKTAAGRERVKLKVSSTNGTNVNYAEVTLTSTTTAKVAVTRVRHSIVYTVGQNEYLLLDGFPGTPSLLHYDSSDVPQRQGQITGGGYMVLQPGTNEFVVALADSDNHPAGFINTLVRAADVTVTVLPGYGA